MGAWGEDVFENDTAGDWTDQFDDDAPPSIVADAIGAAIRLKNPDAEVSSIALAAAEIVAASRGNPCRGLPAEIKTWLARSRFLADDSLAQLASDCTGRIADCSELSELWEHVSQWRRGLKNLQERLKMPAKRTRYRESRVGRTDGIRAAKKAVSDIAGHLSVDRSGTVNVLFPDDLTDDQLIGFLRSFEGAFSTLRDLVLKYHITDRSLQEFHRLPQLTTLYLERSSVTDAGMPRLRELPSLRYLSLAGTVVTDIGLLALVGSRLRCVAVQNSKVTDAGVKRFRQEMPDCFVGPSWEWAPYRLTV